MSTPYEKLADILVEELGQDRDDLSPSATFSEIGLDSLSLAELSVIAMDKTGVEIEDLTPESTLAEAAALLDAAASGADAGSAI
ncbi:phosphopantetheine-binding protein [Streptomyces sp. NBC_01525]|uniref:Acyl carrier protein n=1 Tax=Streptomyces benahoarensis TaxID=2595054 RepID=A0A553YZI9_9ACTN|nr:phosphopantetheine-binding protein [Streptomyces benahoarensis]TSB25612.1 acyl carrier protein [Streptomyces benahoarensis]TSB34574.1 acyl carrier protein [Streptomyces benahoarensis]